MRQGLQWYAILVLAAAALIMMFAGALVIVDAALSLPDRVVDAVGLVFRMATFRFSATADMSSPVILTAGRALWAIVVVVGASKATAQALRKDLRLARARFRRDHVVVCGLAGIGEDIVDRLRAEGQRVVVIERDPEAPGVARLQDAGVAVVLGDGREREVLRAAGGARARAVLATSRSGAKNLEVAMNARTLARDRRPPASPPLMAVARMPARALRDHLQFHDAILDPSPLFEFRTFAVPDNVARMLFRDQEPVPADGAGAGRRHLLVVGFGDTGEAVVEQAMRICHFADGTRLRITVVDREAEDREAAFRARYPRLDEVCDIAFRKALVDQAEFRGGALLGDIAAAAPLASAIIALGDDDANLACGLILRERLAAGDAPPPVFVHLSGNARLAGLLTAGDEAQIVRRGLRVFGGAACTPGSEALFGDALDRLARAVHERYLDSVGGARDDGPPSARPWARLPEFYRQSSRRQADQIGFRLRALGMAVVAGSDTPPVTLTAEEIDLAARIEHRRWSAERRLADWRHGGKRDEVARTHPLLVDWEGLGEPDREANRAAQALLPQLLGAAGYAIRRTAAGPDRVAGEAGP